MRKIINILVLLGACAIGAWLWITDSPEASRVNIEKAKITDISPMLRLCSVEIFDEVPVKGTIGKRHLVAKAVLNGSISFDLDGIETTERNDSLFVTLPREIVEVLESAEPGSYKVIDTWSDSFFGSSNFTTTEENAIKAQARENYRRNIYEKGYVKRARSEAAANLTGLLSSVTGKTVIVTDPSPEGYLDNPQSK